MISRLRFPPAIISMGLHIVWCLFAGEKHPDRFKVLHVAWKVYLPAKKPIHTPNYFCYKYKNKTGKGLLFFMCLNKGPATIQPGLIKRLNAPPLLKGGVGLIPSLRGREVLPQIPWTPTDEVFLL